MLTIDTMQGRQELDPKRQIHNSLLQVQVSLTEFKMYSKPENIQEEARESLMQRLTHSFIYLTSYF